MASSTSCFSDYGFIYEWYENNNTIPFYTGVNPPSISPTTTTTYTLVTKIILLDNQSVYCSGSTQTTINVIPNACCINPSQTFTLDDNLASLTAPPGSEVVVRQGVTLTVNSNITLTDYRFYFESGSKIQITSTGELHLNRTHLQGCGNMWNGISLSPGPGAKIETNSSMIENAITAISFSAFPEYIINSTIFNKNQTSIRISSKPSSNSKIIGSVFTCRDIPHPSGTLTTMYNYASILRGADNTSNINSFNKSPLTYTTKANSVSAIVMTFVGSSILAPTNDITIGDASSNYFSVGNLFDNHDFGIEAFQCNVEIINNVFQEIQGYDQNGNTKGIGVWVRNGNKAFNYSLKIGGSSANEKNIFKNCGIGTLIANYRFANVSLNEIYQTKGSAYNNASQGYFGKYGIKLVNTLPSNYDCNYNLITDIYNGIELAQNSTKSVHCNVIGNNVSTTATSSNLCNKAIWLHALNNSTFGSDGFINVDLNFIQRVSNGVIVENFKTNTTISVSGNHEISLKKIPGNSITQYGIKITNCDGVKIKDNQSIFSNVTGSQSSVLKGIFIDNSNGIAIDCNNISNLGNSIGINHNCIGFPGHGANPPEGVIHNNTFATYSRAIDFMHSSIIDLAQGSKYHASDNQWTHPGGTAVAIQNSSVGAPQETFYIRNNLGYPYSPSQSNLVTPLSIIMTVSNNNAISSVICNTNGSSPSISSIVSDENRDFIEKMARKGINFPVLDTQSKWIFAETAYQQLTQDSTITQSDSVLIDYRDSLQGTNIGNYYNVHEAIKNENWSLATTLNQNISFQNHIEENLKNFNEYYLAYHVDTTLSEDSVWLADMINDLSQIAYECYSLGGPAVLSSRTMLSYFTNQIFPENEDCHRLPLDSIYADTLNNSCSLIKKYYMSATPSAIYSWSVPAGVTYSQSLNGITVNWGNKLLSGGTIIGTVMDSLGNTSSSSFIQDSLITNPTCVAVTANNTSCISATSLSWNNPAECAAGYYVWLGTNGGGTTTPDNIIDSLDIGNDTIYKLPFLQPGITYYYKVVPYNNSHTSVSGCSIGSFTSGSSVAFTPTLGNPYQENFDGVTAPALPCGITVSNENFPKDNFVWETNSSASCSSNNSIAIAKNTDNATAKNDWVYSHPLNLTAGELYRVKYKRKAQAGFTESLATYMSSSADAATMLTTSALNNSSILTASCESDSGDFIAPYSSTFFAGLHANSSSNQATLFVDDLNVSLIKTTHLTTASCGDSLNTCDTLHCITYTGATSYKFKFEDLSNSFSQDYTVNTANPKVYQFLGTNPLVLGQSYSVTVAAYVGGVWTPFGSACDVYVRPVPIRGLTGASCGDTLSDLSQLIYTNTTGICLIANYMYEFTDQSNNTVIETQRNSAVTSFLMTYITTPYVKYSTTYSVRVKLKIGNTWGEYGSACYITTPASPLTKLSSTYCNYTLPTFATPVTCVSVLGAQDYRYKITGPSSYDRTFTRNSSINNWYFTWTNSSPYMQASTTYDVKVASRAGGVWSDYGDVCTITTPATLSRLADTLFLQQAFQPIFDQLENSGNTLSLSIFPNPNNFDEEFSIEIKGIIESNQKIKLLFKYDGQGYRQNITRMKTG